MHRLPEQHEIRNMLFIVLGGIGNLLFLSPAIELLGEKFPKAKVSFLLSKCGSWEIIKYHPRLNLFYEFVKIDRHFLGFLYALRKIRPELTFVASAMDPMKSGLVCWLSGARYRIGENFGMGRFFYTIKVPFHFREHEVESNLRMAQACGCTLPATPRLSLWSLQKESNFTASFLREKNITPGQLCIGVHPGSGSSMTFKRWPIRNFIELCAMLVRAYSAKILVFGGADEKVLGDALEKSLGENAVNCVGQASIVQSYELMKSCRLFISNDSSPLHMATAARIPVVAIFGPTLDFQTRPIGVPYRIVVDRISCRPCYKITWKRTDYFKCQNAEQFACLNNITPAIVFQQVADLYAEVDTDNR